MTREQIKKDLAKRLKKSRYEHTLGVEYTACCLAMRYGADMEKAGLAGLLHDCAKYLTSSELLDYAGHYGLTISPFEKANPQLLHASVGACFARERYGVEKEDILSAITWHTTGRPNMSLLEKILFIADYMEPNRNKQEDLDQVRALAFTDLDQCLRVILTDTVAYLQTRNFVTDPMTEKTWEYYCK